MIRHGEAPFLECSSRGDKRFSALFAVVRGKPIEHWYQYAKDFGFDASNLNWRDRQGLACENVEEVHALYRSLWNEYMTKNSHLLPVLADQSGLSDIFGKKGHACQATELWRIREEFIAGDFPAQQSAP